MSEINTYVKELCERAKSASRVLALADGETRKSALYAMADEIVKASERILSANKLDIENARNSGISESLIDRLMLNEKRITDIASALKQVADLPDPLGQESEYTHANGLKIRKMRVPFGVIAMIYEARPNVTPDAASLCIKSGNAAILRGGKEAILTNRESVKAIRTALEGVGLPADCVCLIDDTSREGTNALFKMKDTVDLLIPRGSKGLIRTCLENSEIPVIETGAGNCHLYIDEKFDTEIAINVAMNAKTSRPSVCNAIETLLVNRNAMSEFLPRFAERVKEFNVEMRCDTETAKFVPDSVPATESDWETEYDDYILAVKAVADVDEAIEHISRYGTKHSEAIITTIPENAVKFQKSIDAAAVYVNASTRFTDGGEFGLGAEIGISTQKMHARGPMGIREITTIKYEIDGNGQVR